MWSVASLPAASSIADQAFHSIVVCRFQEEFQAGRYLSVPVGHIPAYKIMNSSIENSFAARKVEGNLIKYTYTGKETLT